MFENRISPVSIRERIEILDVLRGLAVGGILVGNMQWFSGYGFAPEAIAAAAPLADRVTHFLVHFFIEGKFYSIFSFLFGFGFALQIARAAERGDTKAALFKRRLFWLLVIGVLHAYLLWAGDILSIYALLGFVLLLFRRKSDAALLKWAFALMTVPILTYLVFYGLFAVYVPPESLAEFDAGKLDFWNAAVARVRQGSYFEIISGFNLNYIVGRYAGLIFEMRLPKILAMFLLGFYAYRKGFLQNPAAHQPFIRRVLIYGLAFGLSANVAFAWLAGKEAVFPPTLAGIAGVITYGFGVPALALGIIALAATLWQKAAWRRLIALFAPAGQMALTNYLLHSILCLTIFYGYGFGQFAQVGAFRATVLALGIFTLQIFLSALWLKYFAYGPLEWIWRQLTYRQRINLCKPQQP